MNAMESAIRDAVPEDASAVAEVHVATWRTAYRGLLPDDFLDGLDPFRGESVWHRVIGRPGHPVYVATDGRQIVGFCSLVRSRDADAADAVGEIPAIYVLPAAWRRGWGSRLLTATLEHAAAMTFREVTLWVLDTNAPARAFYEKHRFELDGGRKQEIFSGFTAHELRYRRSVGDRR